jgi:hypothetical protein
VLGVFNTCGEHEIVVDPRSSIVSTNSTEPNTRRHGRLSRLQVRACRCWSTRHAPVAHFDVARLAVISSKHMPAHFAVAATTARPWCPDTPGARRRPWHEWKDSVVHSPAGSCLSPMSVCPSGEHGRGAKGEQTYALNGPERTSTALNGSALTCGSSISAGQRDMPNIVHT